jgi:hypothetical protein
VQLVGEGLVQVAVFALGRHRVRPLLCRAADRTTVSYAARRDACLNAVVGMYPLNRNPARARCKADLSVLGRAPVAQVKEPLRPHVRHIRHLVGLTSVQLSPLSRAPRRYLLLSMPTPIRLHVKMCTQSL